MNREIIFRGTSIDNGSFMLCENKNSTYEELRMNYAVEVVGNIYEHPELIK